MLIMLFNLFEIICVCMDSIFNYEYMFIHGDDIFLMNWFAFFLFEFIQSLVELLKQFVLADHKLPFN